ncbi:acetylornithine deacetylase [Pelagibacterium sp.]|uniref:acetylornithine deacetylase n=1 Tax=Pelagibacterium sp. TaxID=1967288 RepID=UPI003BAC6D63
MNAAEILERLVGFASVSGRPNSPIVDFVAEILDAAGAHTTRIAGPGAGMCNLFASFGPRELPGHILSGHLDVVPAEEPEWTGDPFVLRRDGDRLVGRGAVDMKGFVASVLAAAPRIAALAVRRPIHVALSCDEELGCRGVPFLIARLPELCAAPEGAVIGEPSNLRPVLAHKGKLALRVNVTGRTGHSSRTDLGENAIHVAADIVVATRRLAEALTVSPPLDPRFAPPFSTIQVGTINGGTAVNVIPDRCTLVLEARAIPASEPERVVAPILAEIDRIQAEMEAAQRDVRLTTEIVSSYPPLSLAKTATLAGLVGMACGQSPIEAVSYGTEAGLFQAAGIDSIICGPGDIGRAHRHDEYITMDELEACDGFIERFAAAAQRD